MKLLPEFRLQLFNTLCNSGFENATFLTGGCVRNHLLHREIADVDICVCLPEGHEKLAEYLYQLGLGSKPIIYKHTGTVRIDFQGITLEVSMAKGATKTNQHSDEHIESTCLAEDVLHRDFTINSLYMNLKTGDILDLTGYGLPDIQDGIIRTVVSPKNVFLADPIRILRGIRFAAEYSLSIEDDTWQAMLTLKDNLKLAAPERLKNEFTLMLYGSDPASAFRILAESGSLSLVAPDFSFWLDSLGTTSEAGLSAINALKSCKKDSLSRWLCILKGYLNKLVVGQCYNATGEDVTSHIRRDIRKILKSYYLSEHLINKLLVICVVYSALLIWITCNINPDNKELRRLLFILGNSFTHLKLMALPGYQDLEFSSISLQHLIYRMEDLMLRESDLIFLLNGRLIMDALGISSSPAVGSLIKKARDYWFADPTLGTDDIIKFLKKDLTI